MESRMTKMPDDIIFYRTEAMNDSRTSNLLEITAENNINPHLLL
jgi:hypothetical protein